jgi:stage III sporulation protein AB
MIPLPVLFHQVAEGSSGALKKFFQSVSEEMDAQISPDAGCCMKIVLEKSNDLPNRLHQALMMLGESLGQFDLEGQLKQIAAVKKHCESGLAAISDQRENRIRSYQTLGLCAGAALAILFV